jgi:hypothetical protein
MPEHFDPGKYLTKIGQADYLEVKWRLVWLRSADPAATIRTEMVHFSPGDYAIFRAEIILTTGGSATGFGEEDSGDFRDFVEKAETKALGRALAALGFGTQFTPDFDFGADRERVVDAPVDGAALRARNPRPPVSPPEQVEALNETNGRDTAASQAREQAERADGNEIVSESTLNTLKDHAKAHGWGVATLQSEATLLFGVSALPKLTNDQARQLWRAAKQNPVKK